MKMDEHNETKFDIRDHTMEIAMIGGTIAITWISFKICEGVIARGVMRGNLKTIDYIMRHR